MMQSADVLAAVIQQGGGERPALVQGTQVLSYQGLQEQVWQMAASLSKHGLGQGDRIALMLPNGLNLVVGYLAAIHLGLTFIPVNPDLPKTTHDYIKQVSRPHLVLDEKKLAELTREAMPPPAGHHAESVGIFFTSGTTGQPKGVCHGFVNLLVNAHTFNQLTGLGADCRMMHVFPMTYMAGFLNTVLSPLAAGGCVVLAPMFSPQFALHFWPYAISNQVNALWLSPTMMAILARLNRGRQVATWAEGALHHLFVGTAPLSAAVRKSFQENFSVTPLESYGMTETLLTSVNLPGQDWQPGSVGRLLPGISVIQQSETEQDGQLLVDTPFIMQGYLDPQDGSINTAQVPHPFPTGDMGYVTSAGDLLITGRLKDMIIRGGVNVSPRAVEEVLLVHQAVREAAVVGLPHDIWGEEVGAFVCLEDGWLPKQAEAELMAYLKVNLPVDAVPGRMVFLQELPRNTTGKVLKHKLVDGA
ncbi:MAG: acyl--CoA ligase [Magnetococcales bacterium]|nr:acyl--CoA ligase [Magnetococcales bacterium]NGZ28810.1 acyl--CoA ligase [Magnetococcales bacterium]